MMKKRFLILLAFIMFLVPLKAKGISLDPTSPTFSASNSGDPEDVVCSGSGPVNGRHSSGTWCRFTLSNPSSCGSATVYSNGRGIPVTYKTAWHETRGSFRVKSPISRSPSLNVAFEGCRLSESGTYYLCERKYTRCGASGSEYIAPACYRKEEGDKFTYSWTSSPGSGFKEVKLSEAECKLADPTYCSKSNIIDTKKDDYKCVNTADNSSSGKVVENCAKSSTVFYTITCKEKYHANYNPKLQVGSSESTELKIKAGQGIKYTIDLDFVNTCYGIFDYSAWSSSYNKALAQLNRAKKVGSSKEQAWYNNKIEEIKSYLTQYNNWKPDDNPKVVGSINIKYSDNGSMKDHKDTFDVTKSSASTNKKTNLSCQTLAGIKVCGFEWTVNSIYNLVPPQVYIDVTTGDVSKTKTDSFIDGGRKFYTNIKADKGNGTISTTINILSKTANYTINNSDCNFNIYEKIYENEVYRIVEDSNAFVNNTRKIGKNWSNDDYDFTKIIDKKVAKGDYVYLFDLSRSDIGEIKKNNKSTPDAYLGTCINDKSKTYTGVMKRICNIINSK